MALPTLTVPTFDVLVPSTNKTIKCRPFLVKEEKILLMALESADENESVNAVKQILNNCIVDLKQHEIENFAIFDLEYIFLKIRSRSKGEKVQINYKGIEDAECEECRKTKTYTIDLNKVEIIKDPDHALKIPITDDIGVMMRYPAFSLVEKLDKGTETEIMFDLVKTCIESIYDKENVYLIKDYSAEDTEKFIESLTSEQLERIFKFFLTMPRIEYVLDLGCEKCGRKEVQVLTGLNRFFQ